MGMTLLEASKLAGPNTKRGAIIEIFAKSSPLLAAVQFNSIQGTGVDYDQEGALPGVAFRGINEEYTAGAGVVNPQHDPLKIAGGTLDVDSALVKMMGGNVRAKHEAMKARALSLSIAKTIIKGDSQSNAKEFDGLQRRLTGNQLIRTTTNATDAPAALTIAKLFELKSAVQDPTHWIMNATMRDKLSIAAMTPTVGGYVTVTKDEWGRDVTMFSGLPILVAGKDNTNTEIIPNTETAGDAGADSTSVYCVSMGDGMIEGIQNSTMEVKDLGLLDSGTVYRTLVEWLCGLAVYHSRAGGRCWNIDYTAAITL
jgi:hypothetical protein